MTFRLQPQILNMDVWIGEKNGIEVILVFIGRSTYDHYGCIFSWISVPSPSVKWLSRFYIQDINTRQFPQDNLKYQMLMVSTCFNPSDHGTRYHLEPSSLQFGAFSMYR
ncbi:hypothetical protein HNY73_002333 [Argiope bruennichi]|uniref:Uncharacterized protein n=1 Tax=Argiope bruennichi TaxID=94029 RepID=A0A8T0FUI1_ARGBR|nr:hypothetical protein HNY73_002333 [Argiope bruennichi]